MWQIYYLFAQGNKLINPLPHVSADSAKLHVILQIVFAMFAAVALLVLVIAGLRYVSSNGDPTVMSKSKNTIIYAAVGLVVSMSAYAIVGFALSNI